MRRMTFLIMDDDIINGENMRRETRKKASVGKSLKNMFT